MTFPRAALLADQSRTGASWCRAYSDLVDGWLAELLARASSSTPAGLALVAVGGYGRTELCPHSDIDVMLVHNRRSDVARVAERLWYPIWDEGLHLGHSVCTVREALALAAGTLDVGTALLSARHVAGDRALTAELAAGSRAGWEKRSRRWLVELARRVEQRHDSAGEVAFLLEPDLKEGRGGLRDVHALRWAEAARAILLDYDTAGLGQAYTVLLDARVEMQRRTGRAANRLVLEDQAGVASALGQSGPDELMAGIARAARTIAWISDDAWHRVESMLRGPVGRIVHRPRPLAPGVVLSDGEVALDPAGVPEGDPMLVLRVASLAARHRTGIERQSLERLADVTPPLPDPWPAEARGLLVDLLLAGTPAIGVIESLDQRGVWAPILPEWRAVRSRPQHNPYHRFTVDRHLLEATANAARLSGRVERPDLLVVGALLHDIGKGHEGDHSDAGVVLTQRIATRMGFPEPDVSTLTAMVCQHLLLPDVASRRDLDDPATIDMVAAAVDSVERLHLLAALTEADSLATGPTAWGPWKAELMGRLVERVEQVLNGGEPAGVVPVSFPTPDQLAQLAPPGQRIHTSGDTLTVMTDDRPRIFSRIAGVLALHGVDVVAGAAYSSEDGRALAEFRVSDPVCDEIPWTRVIADLERALDGRLAVNARLAERTRTYGSGSGLGASGGTAPGRATVSIDNQASEAATVIDVHGPDRTGALYRITRALAELDLDVRSARAQTLGLQIVDSFYVRDRNAEKLSDQQLLDEVERAVLHSLAE